MNEHDIELARVQFVSDMETLAELTPLQQEFIRLVFMRDGNAGIDMLRVVKHVHYIITPQDTSNADPYYFGYAQGLLGALGAFEDFPAEVTLNG